MKKGKIDRKTLKYKIGKILDSARVDKKYWENQEKYVESVMSWFEYCGLPIKEAKEKRG